MTCNHPTTCPHCLADRIELQLLRQYEERTRLILNRYRATEATA